jgi:hypothetical protein
MGDSSNLTCHRPTFRTTAYLAARSALGAVLATSIGLITVLIAGVLWWSTIRGFPGVEIAAAVAGLAGAVLRAPGYRFARVLGGLVGGTVAGYFAVAAAEIAAPGSVSWALTGGGYAALFGLPAAFLAGWLASLAGTMVGSPSKSSSPRARS